MWKDCDIPARLFFKIINDNDLSLLGEGTPKEQEDAFDAIFDEYVEIEGNERIISGYKKSAKINRLSTTIRFIETILHAIVFVPMTVDERLELIDTLNSIKGVSISFSKDKPILDEISRVKNVVVGMLQNELNLEVSVKKNHDKASVVSFEEELTNISVIIGYNIDIDINLRTYISYKKIAEKRANANRKVTKNGK